MKAVRRKHTLPEMLVRRLLHSAGYRYRLHVGKLPGSPDIVFPGRNKFRTARTTSWLIAPPTGLGWPEAARNIPATLTTIPPGSVRNHLTAT